MCRDRLVFSRVKLLKRSRKRKRPHAWTGYKIKVANASGSDSSSQTLGMIAHHRACALSQRHCALVRAPHFKLVLHHFTSTTSTPVASVAAWSLEKSLHQKYSGSN